VGVDVVPAGELGPSPRHEQPPDRTRVAAAHLVGGLGAQRQHPPGGPTAPAARQGAPQEVGEGVLGRHGRHVGRRALEHGDVGGLGGQRRHQGDGGGAAPDHHHPLAGVVEVGGPRLWVHDPPAEAVHAREVGLVAAVVAVVAAAGEDEPRGDLDHLARVGALRGDVPASVVAAPVGRGDPVVEPDVLVDAALGGGVLDVAQDRLAVGDGLVAVPGAEGVAQRVHVGVGADAGVPEQVPGAPDGTACLEDGVGGPGALGLDVVAGADARQPRADDEDVEVLRGGHGRQAADPTSLSLSDPSGPNSSACHRSTSASVLRSSGWKSGRS
jgi:hypothetical protein